MDPVVHFEMPFGDRDCMARFYESAFGWKTEKLGPEMGGYVVVQTTETVAGRPTTPGAINGGFFGRTPDGPGQHPSVVIAVDDIVAGLARVIEAGGTVLGEPMQIPGVGQYAGFMDPEGNRVSLLQPLPMIASGS